MIAGFGGVSAAGRSSFHGAYQRLLVDVLPTKVVEDTYLSLAAMMQLVHYKDGQWADQDGMINPKHLPQKWGAYIREHSLIRSIKLYNPQSMVLHRKLEFLPDSAEHLRFKLESSPQKIPKDWQVKNLGDSEIQVSTQSLTAYLADEKTSNVGAAGQLPTGFDPSRLYNATNHPRGLQMAIYGASDALYSMGLSWTELSQAVNPDQIGVYASSSLGQMDEKAAGGYLKAALQGKRPSARYMPFAMPNMVADFVNAYVLGSLGHTTANIGACATFLYNLYSAVQDIQTGARRIAIVGCSEAAVQPEIVEAFRAMGALAEDEQLNKLDQKNSDDPVDHRRACRPFGDNCGFTLGESSQYVVLLEDTLALEVGAQIHGAVAGVFIHADGIKKSISQPGAGNSITLAKACALLRSILGDQAVQQGSFVSAHGTGTLQNRQTESAVLSQVAQAFKIKNWPITAVKAYVGHSTGPASGDQLALMLGVWQHGFLPGICTIHQVAADVEQKNLQFLLQHEPVGLERMQAGLINSKGFGGNNATGVVLAPTAVEKMLQKKHGSKAWSSYLDKRQKTQAQAADNHQQIQRGELKPIYLYGQPVLNTADVNITSTALEFPDGQQINLDLKNPYSDMQS